MGGDSHRPLPAGKSKTDLRRGHFTPGNPAAKKAPPPRRNMMTTNAEQAMLFDVGSGSAK
jgi:hypothetical protein